MSAQIPKPRAFRLRKGDDAVGRRADAPSAVEVQVIKAIRTNILEGDLRRIAVFRIARDGLDPVFATGSSA